MKNKNLLPAFAIALVVLLAGCAKDNTVTSFPPTINSTDPATDAVDVALNKVVTIVFSDVMDPTTINANSFSLMSGTNNVTGTVSYSGKTASFTPASALTNSTNYTATLTTAAKDMVGLSIDANKVWSFTTAALVDVVAPTVTSVDPADNAIGVAQNIVISATFSEPMNPLTISASTISLKKGTVDVAGTVSYDGSAAIFTPTNNLDYLGVYSFTVSTGAKDLGGNNALAAAFESSFTIVAPPDVLAPTITSTDPTNNDIDVVRNKVISVNFSEAMDPTSINADTFVLKQAGTAIGGTVSYTGTTAKFTSSTTFAASTDYTVTITTGATDVAGNPLAANTDFSFTTSGTSAGLAAVGLGTAGNYAILAKTAINNTPTSSVTGDLGLSPAATSYITGLSLTDFTGYATSAQVTGKVFAADMVSPTSINLTTAVENMITAYNDAAGRPTPDFLELGTGNIGGKTLSPGLYKWTSTVTIPTDITISGTADDVWIFQISGDLSMSAAVNVILEGGAKASNIFWQVAGEATFGTTSHFEGIILSMTGITFQTGASFNGRALAQTAVILDGNTVVQPQ